MKKYFLFITFIIFTLFSCSKYDGQYYYEKAEQLINKGNLTKAMTYAQKAENLFLIEEFQWKEVVVLQGEIFLWQNETEKAVQEFDRVMEVFSEDDDVLLNIVVTCVRCNKVETAKEFCTNGILSKKYSDITNGLFYYYLAELSLENDKEQCRDLIMQAKICFLKAECNIFDEKIDSFIQRHLEQ